MDVTAAFLNGQLEQQVYMKQPEGFIVQGKQNLVCKLKHSIYELKQSPRCWNATIDQQLKLWVSSNQPVTHVFILHQNENRLLLEYMLMI